MIQALDETESARDTDIYGRNEQLNWKHKEKKQKLEDKQALITT